MSALHVGARHARTLVVLVTFVVGIAVPAGAGAAGSPAVYANLTGSERAFAKVFKTEMTKFAQSVDAASAPLAKLSGKSTVAQIVAAVTHTSNVWNTAMKPILALKFPTQQPFPLVSGLLTKYLHLSSNDLLAMAQSARTHNEKAYTTAGQNAQTDLTEVSDASEALAKELGISLPALAL